MCARVCKFMLASISGRARALLARAFFIVHSFSVFRSQFSPIHFQKYFLFALSFPHGTLYHSSSTHIYIWMCECVFISYFSVFLSFICSIFCLLPSLARSACVLLHFVASFFSSSFYLCITLGFFLVLLDVCV